MLSNASENFNPFSERHDRVGVALAKPRHLDHRTGKYFSYIEYVFRADIPTEYCLMFIF